MIRPAVDEAIGGGFIECVRGGEPSRAGESPQSAVYQLRWDSVGEYVKAPDCFRGFFEGDGNRTDISESVF